MLSPAFLTHLVVLAVALTLTFLCSSATATKAHYSKDAEALLRTTCGQRGKFCIALQDKRIQIPKYKNQASDLWQAPLGKSGGAVFVTDKTAVGHIDASCKGGHSRLTFDFTDAPNVRWDKGILTAYWLSVPNVKIEEAGSAIQGHVGGGDTLHVMCKNEKSKKKVA